MRDSFRALYLHVPFCVQRCAYCDFCTEAVAVDDARIDAHVVGLRRSLARAAEAGLLGSVQTVYIGGGTPTFLGAERLDVLLSVVNDALALDGAPVLLEFTVEANPDSLSSEMLDVLAARGVTRLSIGVQSLDDSVLATLGRVHDASAALDAVRRAVARIGNISADVICGVPGQTRASLADTLARLLGTGVSHVSIYPLMVEEGTPLERAIEAGELPDMDEDEQAAHMLLAAETLQAAGLTRYEVASYALPGRESRHNTAYWTGAPYLGLGLGASSMMDAADFETVQSTGVFDVQPVGDSGPSETLRFAQDDKRGVDRDCKGGMVQDDEGSLVVLCECVTDGAARVRVAMTGKNGTPEIECLTMCEAACEDAMLAMRMSAGIARGRLKELATHAPGLLAAADQAVSLDLARWTQSGTRLVPTERGWLMGNELYSLFWDCASL